jgi:hypothetical protein
MRDKETERVCVFKCVCVRLFNKLIFWVTHTHTHTHTHTQSYTIIQIQDAAVLAMLSDN